MSFAASQKHEHGTIFDQHYKATITLMNHFIED